jgi:4a-hydroxytetrahydrobiopterin dehydratase
MAVSDERVRKALATLPGWQRAGAAIEKTYAFKNYYETMAFVNATAWVSHATDHHPDLMVGYNRCRVSYTTHDAGGLSEKDLQCAARVEALVRNSIS